MSTKLEWVNAREVPIRTFVCGHCGTGVASQTGYVAEDPLTGQRALIYICHRCHRPNFFDVDGKQIPASAVYTDSAIRRKLHTLP